MSERTKWISNQNKKAGKNMKVYTKEKLEEYILSSREKHYRIAYSYIKNKEDALDIIQDAIYKALSYKGEIKDEYMETWFCKIVINTSKDYLKKSKKLVNMEDYRLNEVIEKQGIITGDNDFEKGSSHEIHDALEKLSSNEREIITLRYFEAMEIKEVSELTDQNINTVKSTLYRALKKLQVILA